MVGYEISRKRHYRLLSVRAAKELALMEGASIETLSQDLEHRRTTGVRVDLYYCDRWYFDRWLQAAPLEPLGKRFALRPSQANVPDDKFCGMASVPFPSLLPEDRVGNGLWCLGCEKNYYDWHSSASGVPGDTERTSYESKGVERSETEFLEHIRQCPGAMRLVPDLEEKLSQILHA